MTNERRMSYEPQVGDKVRFLMDTYDETYRPVWAFALDTGRVDLVAGDIFRVAVERSDGTYGYIQMCSGPSARIPHCLTRIECIESVPTPCSNQVDVDAVMRRCGDKVSCDDVELKVLTVMEMCREIRRYRLEEKARKESEE